jgi:hypothetical protein
VVLPRKAVECPEPKCCKRYFGSASHPNERTAARTGNSHWPSCRVPISNRGSVLAPGWSPRSCRERHSHGETWCLTDELSLPNSLGWRPRRTDRNVCSPRERPLKSQESRTREFERSDILVAWPRRERAFLRKLLGVLPTVYASAVREAVADSGTRTIHRDLRSAPLPGVHQEGLCLIPRQFIWSRNQARC